MFVELINRTIIYEVYEWSNLKYKKRIYLKNIITGKNLVR